MKTLIHLCKKDFAFAKPWIVGTWLAFAIGNILPWVSPAGEASLPFVMIRLLAPAVMIFLASTRIIHCDPFVGSSGFMGTRPLRATTLLRNKVILIALVLVLPAVGFALLHAACLRVQLSAVDYMLLFIENWLFFSIIVGAAVVFSSISCGVGSMVLFIGGASLLMALYGAYLAPHERHQVSQEELHLRASIGFSAQVFLPIAAVAIAMSWAAGRRIRVTVAVFLLSAGILALLGKRWNWNFVDDLSKDAATAEIVAEPPTLQWLDEPRFGSNSTRNGIKYSQVLQPASVIGLKNGWMGKLVKFKSEARFADGTTWTSEGGLDLFDSSDLSSKMLPQLGIDVARTHDMQIREDASSWTWFECEKSHLQGITNPRASIRGRGTFQLYQLVILAELPARTGATVAGGRCQFRIDSASAIDQGVSVILSFRGLILKSKGDGAGGFQPMELLLLNPLTKKVATKTSSGGSDKVASDWNTIHQTYSLDRNLESADRQTADEFIKGARLYILGTRYGGNIVLPYEIPEMTLEEKH